MRMLSLPVFAALALIVGAYEEDGMMLVIGFAAALSACLFAFKEGTPLSR